MAKSLSYFFLRRIVLSHRSASLIRRISILSFFGIMLSVALFFVVLFVMNGMNQNIKNRILALDPHLSALSPAVSPVQALLLDYEESVLTSRDGTAISYMSYDLILRTVDGQFRGSNALGYTQSGLDFWKSQLIDLRKKAAAHIDMSSSPEKNNINSIYNLNGEHEFDLTLNKGEIAVGIDLARSLGLLEGDIVTLIPAESLLLSSLEAPIFEKVTVKKILTTDLQDLDAKLIFFNKDLSLKSMQKSPSQQKGLHIWLKDIGQIDTIQEQLTKKGYLEVETWKQKNSALFSALFLEKTMIGIFLGLAGLIASSSILTVLALIMSQKKMDIAVIKTLGFSSQKTLKLFTTMGLWISLSGLFLGTFIGISVGYYLQFYPLNILPQIYYDSTIPAQVNLEFAVYVLIVGTVLAFLGCYIPAKTSLKIEPAILLKSK